jgi:hypothetical protein
VLSSEIFSGAFRKSFRKNLGHLVFLPFWCCGITATLVFMEQAAGFVAGAPPVVGMGMSVALTLISGFSTGLGGLIAAFLGALFPPPHREPCHMGVR